MIKKKRAIIEMFTVVYLLVMGITLSAFTNIPIGITEKFVKEIKIPHEDYVSENVNLSNQQTEGRWYQMPEAPLEGRFMYSSILTDKKLIIWECFVIFKIKTDYLGGREF